MIQFIQVDPYQVHPTSLTFAAEMLVKQGGDSIHYLLPKEKYHNLNFNGGRSYFAKSPAIYILDAKGALRIERKNKTSDLYTDADVAYIYTEVKALAPSMNPRVLMGWKPIDINTIPFHEYTCVKGALPTHKADFSNGMFKGALDLIPNKRIYYRQAYFSTERSDSDWADNKHIRNIRASNIVKINGEYQLLDHCEAMTIFHDENIDAKIDSGDIKFVASLEVDTCFMASQDRNDVVVCLACEDVDDIKAVFGKETSIIHTPSLSELTTEMFKHYEEDERYIDYKNGLLKKGDQSTNIQRRRKLDTTVILTYGDTALIFTPSVSDIHRLPHTLKLLQEVR